MLERSMFMPRLFLALFPPLEVREQLAEVAAHALEQDGTRRTFRSIPAGNLHLTLLFLGQVETGQVAGLLGELAKVEPLQAALQLRLTRPGGFPASERARVLWWGVEDEPAGNLNQLRARVLCATARALPDARQEEEQRFHAHITLARARTRPAALPEALSTERLDLCFRPREFVLVESRVGGSSPRYLAIASFAL